jgi:hypothetical protein
MEKQYDRRLNKDNELGTFITKSLKKDKVMGQCPSIEDIAALIDGKLEDGEKNKIMAHITNCPDCYEIFSQTSKDILFLSESKRQKVSRITIPALAMAVCLILVVRISFYSPVTNLPYSHEMIGQLSSLLKTSDLEPELITRGPGTSGLAGSLGLLTLKKQQAFLLGFYTASLELTIVGENPEQAQKQLTELVKILKWGKRSDVGSLKKLEEVLAKNSFIEASEEIHLLQKEMAADMKEETISSFYHIGMWSSIGQTVLKSGNKEAIEIFLSNKKQLKAMKLLLEKESAPLAILEDLGKIMVITEGETFGDGDYQDIFRHIQRINDYLSI